MSEIKSIQEIFDLARQYHNPSHEVDLVSAIVQIHISGTGGGDWFIKFANRDYNVTPGVNEAPDFHIDIDVKDCLAIVNGQLNPVTAYMLRKVDFSGDIQLAKQLRHYFSFPDTSFFKKINFGGL